MVQVEERFMMRVLHRTGMSVSEIARQTGHDRKTVRRIVSERQAPRSKRARRSKVRKIDPYVPYLERRIDEGVLNAQKLFFEIKALGYPGEVRAVRRFVQPLRTLRQAVATVRFETEPGRQAQVDWGHFGRIEHQGRQRRLYGFVMTLGWSRCMYLEFTVSADAAWFLRCHKHAFEYFGGIPQEVLHDNLKTAVIDRDAQGGIHFNARYLDFAETLGFRPRACRPYRAQTKGKVESGVRYVRGNFWLGLSFVDLYDLNQQALGWLNTVANVRIHGTSGEVPFERLPHEGLQPLLGRLAYDTSLLAYRRSTKDCLVSYEGSYYSVPAAHARQQLKIRHTEQDELVISTLTDLEIARHRLATGHRQRIVDPSHYDDLWAGLMKGGDSQQTQPAATLLHRLAQQLEAPPVEVRPLCVYDQLLEVMP